ncbi:MAG: hypothetical protein A3F10_06540 [Coxiella sp. RIFCSPHIGHO2_12_FULL_42_15]|nr:MAG: hypothetical protein A3F10_06540 [Coxiella sp. RIFCSPHIGHO2_12_FULL_42_15]
MDRFLNNNWAAGIAINTKKMKGTTVHKISRPDDFSCVVEEQSRRINAPMKAKKTTTLTVPHI